MATTSDYRLRLAALTNPIDLGVLCFRGEFLLREAYLQLLGCISRLPMVYMQP
ncbi:MAG: hypothetical protein ACR2NX_08880 [Chthoniobacterales bacterium]